MSVHVSQRSGLQTAWVWLLAFVVSFWSCTLCAAAPGTAPAPAGTTANATEAPLVIAHRTVHVFRAPMGEFSAAERAEGARQRILRAMDAPGEGWTSVSTQAHGVMVELDGKPMFIVVAEDAPKESPATADSLANAASHTLQKAWSDERASRDKQTNVGGWLRALAALVALCVAWAVIWKLSRLISDALTRQLARRVAALDRGAGVVTGSRLTPMLLDFASKFFVLLNWLLSLLVLFGFLTYVLNQFAYTRAMGEGLSDSFVSLTLQSLGSVAGALPGMFIAVLIFLLAWACTQISGELFKQVAAGRVRMGMLDQHTAPVTRHIVNASLWLFALAMAYPYLPGAQSEAFKGLSVLLGIMVSIGASGLVGQVVAGMILIYTRALSLGEYVRIQDCEGTVTEISLFVTRLRTGTGEEYALPNSLVLGNITKNLSRLAPGGGYVLDTTITIGYDTPWRQVQAMMLEAAHSLPQVAKEPAPYVVQTALSDYYVAYRLVVLVQGPDTPNRALVSSSLNAAILDAFNRYGVQIMSPNYRSDPDAPKMVPESDWYAAPAKRP
jgi:small-conductance mechanosensitive channel